MTITNFLARLSSVRRAGEGRWIARCPAHDDRRPSLSIARGRDGRTLIYCFGGCSPAEVLAEMGLRMVDLYPERVHGRVRG